MNKSLGIRCLMLPFERQVWSRLADDLHHINSLIKQQQGSTVHAIFSHLVGQLTGDRLWKNNLYSLNQKATALKVLHSRETERLFSGVKQRGGLIALALTGALFYQRGLCSENQCVQTETVCEPSGPVQDTGWTTAQLVGCITLPIVTFVLGRVTSGSAEEDVWGSIERDFGSEEHTDAEGFFQKLSQQRESLKSQSASVSRVASAQTSRAGSPSSGAASPLPARPDDERPLNGGDVNKKVKEIWNRYNALRDRSALQEKNWPTAAEVLRRSREQGMPAILRRLASLKKELPTETAEVQSPLKERVEKLIFEAYSEIQAWESLIFACENPPANAAVSA